MYGSYDLMNDFFICYDYDVRLERNIVIYFKGNLFLDSEKVKMVLSEIAREYPNVVSLKNFKGSFALILLDKNERRLCLIRDQFGVIPLYYSIEKQKIIFGTTMERIIMERKHAQSINERVLHEYFVFRYISGEATIFNNIYEVKPASVLAINSRGQLTKKDYYGFQYSNGFNQKDGQPSALFEKTFWESLNKMTFDKERVVIGVLSSGGIDSSILVSCASKILQPNFGTYYIASEGYEYNRTAEVDTLSKLYNTNQKNIFISSKEFSNHLIETVKINEEPLNHPSSVLRNYLYKQIKGEVDVLLSGEGADCFFCGYYIFDLINWFYVKNPVRSFTHFIMSSLPVSLFPKRYQGKVAKIKKAFVFPPDEFSIFHDLLVFNTREKVNSILEDDFPSDFANNYTSLFLNYSRTDIMDIILHVYQTLYMIEALKTLTKLEKIQNIEHRHVFINVNLINLFNQFPWNEKIRFFQRKHQVIQLGKRNLPKEFFKKRKEGFGVPLSIWFYDKKGLGRYISLLSDKKTRERGIFKVSYLDKLLDKYHKKNLPDDSFECIIWPIINMELWFRIFIDKDVKGFS